MGLGRDIFYALGATLTSPIWGYSLLRTGKWRTDWKARLGYASSETSPAENQASTTPNLLIYAVSVGEVNATRPLVAWFEQHRPEVRLTLATMTNTGFARAQQLYQDRYAVARFPFDFSGAVNRFLNHTKPTAVALMELEVWPNFIEACNQHHIPVAVINGRLTERSYKGYRKALPLIRPAFRGLAFAGVQAQEHIPRFAGVGVPAEKIAVLDSMKWEGAVGLTPEIESRAQALAVDLGVDPNKPTVVAGSTAPGEDELLIDALSTWPQGTQLILAPRKPEWFDHVADLAPGRIVRRSAHTAKTIENRKPKTENPIYLLDTIGELRDAYALADVCIVGRSFTGELYGSDLMEPIALGKAAIIGPHHSDFQDAVDAFAAQDAVVISSTPGKSVADLLSDKNRRQTLATNGLRVIASRRGAAERYGKLMCELIDNN